jgi:hypothetical protein
MREDSIIALIQNMPQIKDIVFDINSFSIRKFIPYFGHNIRSLSISDCIDLRVEHLNVIKNNTNFVQLSLNYNNINSQQIFDSICDIFSQLQNFGFKSYSKTIALIKLIQLNKLKKNFN